MAVPVPARHEAAASTCCFQCNAVVAEAQPHPSMVSESISMASHAVPYLWLCKQSLCGSRCSWCSLASIDGSWQLIGAARGPIGLMTGAEATDHLDLPRSIHWSFRSAGRAASMLAAAGATAGGSECSSTPWWVMTVTLSYSARLSNISLVKRQMASPAPPLGASHRHRL